MFFGDIATLVSFDRRFIVRVRYSLDVLRFDRGLAEGARNFDLSNRNLKDKSNLEQLNLQQLIALQYTTNILNDLHLFDRYYFFRFGRPAPVRTSGGIRAISPDDGLGAN